MCAFFPDVFKILFFVLLGICCLSASVTVVICFPHIRNFILSKLQRNAAGHNQHSSVGRVIQARRHSVTSIPATGAVPSITPPTAQGVGNRRIEGEGSSQTERSVERREEIRQEPTRTRHMSNTELKQARSQSNSATNNKRDSSVTYKKVDVYERDKKEERSPFLNHSEENAHLRDLKTDDEPSGAVPHNELQSVHSSGYQALDAHINASRDTGYRTASSGHEH